MEQVECESAEFCLDQGQEGRGGGRGRESKVGSEERRESWRKGGTRTAHIGQRGAASHAKQKSLSLRLNMIPHLLSMY